MEDGKSCQSHQGLSIRWKYIVKSYVLWRSWPWHN